MSIGINLKKEEKDMFVIRINDGFCEYEYGYKHDNLSINDIAHTIIKVHKGKFEYARLINTNTNKDDK